jgi:DNA-binding response OmpR family regulator
VGGSVSVNVSIDGQNELQIKIQDSGIGIGKGQQEKIFERFFQADISGLIVNQGSGIGLSIAKEFAKIMGGSISLQSTPAVGSCFTVHLPVAPVGATTKQLEMHDHIDGDMKPVLLLADDNEDFRSYLREHLKTHYTIHEAGDGVRALELSKALLPDLIVSDVMMPQMTGVEVCRDIKSNTETSHIPVILLTARSTEEQKVEGLSTGADDYITKPFNFEILQLRIKNLIQKRETFQKDFRKQMEVKGSAIQVTSLDEMLIKKAIQFVESRITDAGFSVEDLSSELNMSRVHLYKKLMAITGKSPLEFIRVIRLQRAAQLLEKSQLTVAEIAYQVGFNNPKYFSRYFRDEYKMLPSAYAAMKREQLM